MRNTTSEIFVTSMEGQVWRSVGLARAGLPLSLDHMRLMPKLIISMSPGY